MFQFEDMIHLNDRSIQMVLKEVENLDLVMAMKLCSDELKKKIFSNMSIRAVSMAIDEIALTDAVDPKVILESQQRIVDIIRRLNAAGELVFDDGISADRLV